MLLNQIMLFATLNSETIGAKNNARGFTLIFR